MTSTTPSRTLVHSYAAFYVLGYWVVYFLFPDIVPEKYLRDAVTIRDLIQGNLTSDAQSFHMTAALFSALPLHVTHTLVGLFNGYVIWRIVSTMRTFRGMALVVPVILPLILLNLMSPLKETIVLLITLFIGWLARRMRSELVFVSAVTIIYILYGSFLRTYYLLILFLFLGYWLILKTPRTFRGLYIFIPILGLLLLPNSVYMTLEGARDQNNFWNGFGNIYSIRTFFNNPFPPDGPIHFLANYIYAFIKLNFPLFANFTANEIILLINVLIYGWLMITSIRRMRGPLRLLGVLFAAHITVSILFEPDLGSYFRHFSSTVLYLLPAWLMLEEEHEFSLLHKSNKNNRLRRIHLGSENYGS